MPGNDPGHGFGEQVTTTVDHSYGLPHDCLSWAAIIFSTTVQDADGDGLPDKLEDISGLKEPDGAPLPDLHAMGASKLHKDCSSKSAHCGPIRAPRTDSDAARKSTAPATIISRRPPCSS